ncbi:flavin-containing monooxygenase [Pseudonocardia endophytica]|uniref:Cation diffusion facilitator CzcD-associated flavoprotein CzcO n=1 Tax=Pseudonocardia endophytica TaxID=401976 RepID=A0A4R1HKB3_PSEEN|nr:NAD(P)/FAD-dependent oxidoreductase [Pseudonocardia endophytica]TCK20009.1 cation diffusion facilitator CzcD-associated flavoprotein CzcO [Pseudonocardia endophytica]
MSDTQKADLDALVIGAGFAGIYMLRRLRDELGLDAKAYDSAPGVGGTWYWNRYPGAMSDTETYIYRYSWDKEMLQEWDWDTRYLNQPDILRYLEAVVERHDLGRDIVLNTSIDSTVYDDARGIWTCTTQDGTTITARYLVTALGLLSHKNYPDIKGRDSFQGTLVHTGAWPADLTVDGKRVGLIGTGSTGCQVICAASKTAQHLTVFQRSAQYSVPSGNGPVDQDYVDRCRADYDRIFEQVKTSAVGFGFDESTVPAMSVSEEERQRVFQENWDIGNGFRFMFGTFADIATSEDANKAACDFIRAKIDEIVDDPETARKLKPTEYYARRPLCNKDYYETFNRDNVTLVSIRENPITEITPNGVLTEDGVEHELDILVFATGFEAVDGQYTRMDLRGRDGLTIQQHWKDAPTSYLGVATNSFPNMFMITGPNGPFSNIPPAIEVQVDWVYEIIKQAEAAGAPVIEAAKGAEDGWTETCREIASYTLFDKSDSWIFGANIPGKRHAVQFYMAGLGAYRQLLADEAAAGFPAFGLDRAPATVGV